ncbi:hypothetical protein BDR07DRAFT_1431586 [Suillus spraguei]|nr:hypothetical protein BDR07DRAFT_1431586 [Suillus spraguei]
MSQFSLKVTLARTTLSIPSDPPSNLRLLLPLPGPTPSSSTRSARVTAGLHSRLNCMLLLDKYMRRLRNCCPVHFSIDCQVHAKGACTLGSTPHDSIRLK